MRGARRATAASRGAVLLLSSAAAPFGCVDMSGLSNGPEAGAAGRNAGIDVGSGAEDAGGANGWRDSGSSDAGSADALDAGGADALDAGDADALDAADDAGGCLLCDDFENYTPAVWAEGTTHGPWRVVFAGGGNANIVVEGTSNQVLSLEPMTPDGGDTHSALVVSTVQVGDASLSARLSTVAQTRAAPNPWEVAWLLWRYTDPTHFYYLILKPNGWELGKEDPAYPGNQRFLVTASAPTFPVGASHVVRVDQVGATMTVSVDGAELTSFTDAERPYGAGAIGLYVEDARASFDDVRATAR